MQLATVQALLVHAAVPLATVQETPQAPHAVTVDCRLVSQPLALSPSQFPKPALHVPMAHAPPVQFAAALANEQLRPHAPQCERLVLVFVSQPLPELRSQSPVPAGHEPTPHVPLLQMAPAAVHAFPQVPQLFTSRPELDSQPFDALPSQFR